MSGGRRPTRPRVQVQWLVLAAALTVLAGLVVGWALTDAADRIDVVAVARPVAAGEVFELDDLRVSQVAFDSQVTGLVPALSAANLVGRVATIDLEPGTLLTAGMWADDTGLAPHERTVGAVLEPGRVPAGLSRGDAALAVAIIGRDGGDIVDADPVADDADTVDADNVGDDDSVASGVVAVRVLEVAPAESGGWAVTLAVTEVHAPMVARLAATDALVLVGVPAVSAPAVPVNVDPAASEPAAVAP